MIALICFIVFSQAYKPVLYAPLLDRGSINYNKQGICIDMDLLDLMNTLFLKAKLFASEVQQPERNKIHIHLLLFT